MSSGGQIIGGVVGGIIGFYAGGNVALGASIGMAIGGYLDPPKTQDNRPRPDLTVQTATYGAQIGSGDGNYAAYGNIFWLENNLLQFSEGGSGGKGGSSEPTPDEVYGTFAVGFGEGEIAGFGRIWCNGNLVYDPTAGTIGAKMANGNISGNLSFYLGSATQLPDDRIQADMGATYAPGYRRLHSIVFKDWPMADYGNSLMGMQVKAEILNSVTVDQYAQLLYDDTVLPDTNTFPGAVSTEYGYFNPRFENGVFYCEKSSVANDYEYTFAVSPDGTLLAQYPGSTITGVFGYIGSVSAGVVAYSGTTTGTFTVSGSAFKLKTSDENNTCHGMAVGADGKIYTLERLAGAWNFNIYDGSSLSLISSGTNNSIRFGDNNISLPCIPGTNVTFCIEADGAHVWTATEGGGEHDFKSCIIDGSGNLSSVHTFSRTTESHLGAFARFSAIYAVNGICYGVNDHGGFFVYDRNEILTPTSVPLSDIIERRCLLSGLLEIGDLDTSEITQMVRGYRVPAITSIRSALEPLQGAWPFDVLPSGYQIKFKPRGSTPVAALTIDELGAASGSDKIADVLTQSREMDSQLPVKVQVVYIDVNREYDKGSGAGAWRSNTDAVNVSTIEMPIVLNADEAAGIEETLLYLYWMERIEFRFALPPTRWALEVCDVVTLTAPGASYELRLTEISSLPDGRVECYARLNNPAIYTPTAKGQEGQSTGQVLTYPGPTFSGLLDLPCVDSTLMDKPGFISALDGYSSDWTGGTLYSSDDQGMTWNALNSLMAPGSMMGTLVSAPGSGRTDVIDCSNVIVARFYSPANLSSPSFSALYAGGNHFAVGANGRWEIIGAKTVVDNGDGTWALSDLLRGRYGTESNTGGHIASDSIILLDSARLSFIGVATSSIGLSKLYCGVTMRQTLDPQLAQTFTYSGNNLECLPPIQIKGAKNSSSDWGIAWTRRTRTPVEPFSGINTPLGETSEAYEVEIWDSAWATLKRTITGISSPSATYTNAQQVNDFGSVQKLIYVKVYQLSATVGRGYAGQATCGNLELLNVKSLMHFDDSPILLGMVLGMHMDGTNGSTVFTDVKGKAVTVGGNAQISTAQYPALTGKTSSGYFDGSGDYLSIPDSDDWNFGTGDLTIRFWCYPTGSGANAEIVAHRISAETSFWYVRQTSTGKIQVGAVVGGVTVTVVDSTNSLSINAWNFVEVVRTSASVKVSIGGTFATTVTTDSSSSWPSASTSALYVGVASNTLSNPYLGYISELEIYKGIALHTSNFTPPSAPFSSAAQQILDKAENSITVNGTAVTVIDAGSFGGYCLQANQAGGYIETPAIDLSVLYWTIDLWIKPDALPASSYMGVFDYASSADGGGGLCVVVRNDGLVMCFFGYGIEINLGVSTASAGNRSHVFIQRSGDRFYIGSAGVVGSSLLVSSTSFVGNKAFRIGYANVTGLETKAIKIDEFRVFAGEAKYPLSGKYSVPTTPFPDL